MIHETLKFGPAMAAIAAVFALSSSQLFAQVLPEATQPVTVEPVITVPEIPPQETTPSEPSTTSAGDPIATEPATATTLSNSTTTRGTARTRRPAKAAPSVARASVARTPVARTPAAVPVAQPVETAVAAPRSLTPIPTAPPTAVVATPPAQEAPAESNDMLAIGGAAALGLFGLIGLGLAMRRRKLRRDEEFADADQYEPVSEDPEQTDPLFAESTAPVTAEPIPAIPVAAASGIVAASAPAATTSACVDTAPGSHVEAACAGPTADNPSLSIKKRLKRAQFFDQREFLVAAGEAAPMAPDAGLPDAVEVPVSPIDKPA